jgi:hypothetical protein
MLRGEAPGDPVSERTIRDGRPERARRARLASFRVRDAYHPPAAELLARLFGDVVLQGRVAAASENGQPGGGFVVLEVDGCEGAVIVPASSVVAWCEE